MPVAIAGAHVTTVECGLQGWIEPVESVARVLAKIQGGQDAGGTASTTSFLHPAGSGPYDGWRTWNGFDRDAMDRLQRKGMISDPVGKARSVVPTEEGRREAERLFRELSARRP